MAVDWEAPDLQAEIKWLLEEGATRQALAQRAILEGALRDEVWPDTSHPQGKLLDAVLKQILDQPRTRELRAAREYLGWTKATYEEVFQIAKEAGISGTLLGPDASDDMRDAAKEELLKKVTVRRKLASLQLRPKTGFSAKWMKDTYLAQITFALRQAISSFPSDAKAVRAVSNKLLLEPPEALSQPATQSGKATGRAAPWWRRRSTFTLGAVGLIVLTTILMLGWTWYSDRISEDVPVQITEPPEETPPCKVLRVISVRGIGDVPQDHHLWVFVYAPEAQLYFPQAIEDSADSEEWSVTGINLGSRGEIDVGSIFTIYALVVDDSTNIRINNLLGQDPEGAYSQEAWDELYRQFEADRVEVERSAEPSANLCDGAGLDS